MPVYEYLCKACGHEFEREQRISDKPVKKCPSCGALQAKRLISRTSFVLKGGGWYGDLYSSTPPAKKAEGADAKGETKGEAKGDGKSESASEPAAGEKPAAKPAAKPDKGKGTKAQAA
jgi:putative FmdB family regulatory protein